jgi:hypothetical protein
MCSTICDLLIMLCCSRTNTSNILAKSVIDELEKQLISKIGSAALFTGWRPRISKNKPLKNSISLLCRASITESNLNTWNLTGYDEDYIVNQIVGNLIKLLMENNSETFELVMFPLKENILFELPDEIVSQDTITKFKDRMFEMKNVTLPQDTNDKQHHIILDEKLVLILQTIVTNEKLIPMIGKAYISHNNIKNNQTQGLNNMRNHMI